MCLIDYLDAARRTTTGSAISDTSCLRFMLQKLCNMRKLHRGCLCTHHTEKIHVMYWYKNRKGN